MKRNYCIDSTAVEAYLWLNGMHQMIADDPRAQGEALRRIQKVETCLATAICVDDVEKYARKQAESGFPIGATERWVSDVLEAAIAVEVAAEREACAQMMSVSNPEIARAIRARGKK